RRQRVVRLHERPGRGPPRPRRVRAPGGAAASGVRAVGAGRRPDGVRPGRRAVRPPRAAPPRGAGGRPGLLLRPPLARPDRARRGRGALLRAAPRGVLRLAGRLRRPPLHPLHGRPVGRPVHRPAGPQDARAFGRRRRGPLLPLRRQAEGLQGPLPRAPRRRPLGRRRAGPRHRRGQGRLPPQRRPHERAGRGPASHGRLTGRNPRPARFGRTGNRPPFAAARPGDPVGDRGAAAAVPDRPEADMLAIVAAIVFALALLFDLADVSSDAINNGTLTVLGLLLVALHLAGVGAGANW